MSQNRMIRRMVHDLRAPLRALATLPAWMREDLAAAEVDLPASVEDHLQLMEREALRMDGFLTGLQALCKAGDPDGVASLIDPEAEIARVITELPPRPGIEIRFERAGSLPDAAPDRMLRCVRCDFALLIRHLVHNAQHHHDRDQGRVIVRCSKPGREIVIEIVDDGPGIAAEDQRRVFEPFTTLKSRDEVEGAGLGLALAARVTAAIGGRIELYSEGRGTRVRASLPACPET